MPHKYKGSLETAVKSVRQQLDNLEEMDTVLQIYNVPRLKQA